MKKLVLVVVAMALVFSFVGCATTGKIPDDAQGVNLRNVLAGGDLIMTALKLISEVDPQISEDIIYEMVDNINEYFREDPEAKLYWIPSSNAQVSTLSEKSAEINGSIVIATYSLRYLAGSVKAAARDATGAEAVEDIMAEEDLTITEQELLDLKGKELSDMHKQNLKNSFIYMTLAVSALIQAPINAVEFVDQAKVLAEDPSKLVSSPTAVPKMAGQLKSIIDNLNNVIKEAPALIKNLTANIEIVVQLIENS
jgi:hypothetical protein